MADHKDKASPAQARFLAKFWGQGAVIKLSREFNDSTTLACRNRGWIEPTGHEGAFPNGKPFDEHIVSSAGLDAIAEYLADLRYSRLWAERDARAGKQGAP